MAAVRTTLDQLARQTRDAANQAARAHAAERLAEERIRNETRARDLLVSILAGSDLEAHAGDATASFEDPLNDDVILTFDGVRLLYRNERPGWEYAYHDPHFQLLERCAGCGTMEAAKSGRIRTLFDLADVLDSPAPNACEACWEDTPTASPPPPTTAEQLLAALERFVDERVPPGAIA